jgi:hypothetical protein
MKIAFGVIAHEYHLPDGQPQPRQMIPINARIGLALTMFHRTRHPLHVMSDAKPFEVVRHKAGLVRVSKH